MDHPLSEALATVPARMATVADWPTGRRIAAAQECADTIAAGADLADAGVGEAVATGVAILAHRPGGVELGGGHWCQHPHAGCPGAGGELDLPAPGDGRSRGAVYTPRQLADELAARGLGPWTEHASSVQILALRVCDPAAGSGALLVAACRYLADRLVEAWRRESGVSDVTGQTVVARRLVQRCLYGGDLDPSAAALARVAVALLAPTVPDLMHTRIVAGDMLIGHANVQQLTELDPACFPAGAAVHWPLTYPEVYTGPRAPGFDAVICNVPYLGGQKITGAMGKPYRDHLVKVIAAGVRGSADLAAYCLLRAHDLVQQYGTVSIIATDTLWQGSSRRVGLDQLVDAGWHIWHADKQRPWPDDAAAVTYCMVHTVGGPDVTRPAVAPQRPDGVPVVAGGADWVDAMLAAVARTAAT